MSQCVGMKGQRVEEKSLVLGNNDLANETVTVNDDFAFFFFLLVFIKWITFHIYMYKLVFALLFVTGLINLWMDSCILYIFQPLDGFMHFLFWVIYWS